MFKIVKCCKKFDRRSGTYHINISYRVRTRVTPRTVVVSEAFGLGIDKQQRYVVYGDVELRIGPTDVVYITGSSGSGKSALLKTLEKLLKPNTINLSNVIVDSKKPLIDTVGWTVEQGLELLSRVGLNDAFLFVRRYDQLSDGQRYRYRIAKLIESKKQYWFLDEFCATLDRDTAKVVAFNLQKLARQEGKAVFVATTHEDLLEDLQPSIIIKKGFGNKVEVTYREYDSNAQCSLVRDMNVVEGTRKDYDELAPFHYRSSSLAATWKIFALKRGEETVGVIVYRYPGANCFGRRQAFGRALSLKEVNEKVSLISRVIIHPKYRTIGLGAKLVRATLPLCGKPYVETVAVMAKYNPFFEKAGMTKIAESKPDPKVSAAIEKLKASGFNPLFLSSEKYNMQILLDNPLRVKLVREILSSLHNPLLLKFASSHDPYGRKAEYQAMVHNAPVEKLAKMLRTIAVLAQTKVYLFWANSANITNKDS
jgi:ABC-type lipoprotein export system ATPase subunit/GNAT superfamily N-acetyltransferase